MTKITLSPVTRVSGLLSVNLYLDAAGMITEADCSGDQFRGFETMLRGRAITDAVYFTQRICGICSMAHGYTAARLVEQIFGLEPPAEVILVQQAMLGAEFLQNHIRHFYLLALPDYLDPQPDYPIINGIQSGANGSRFSETQQRILVDHYFQAMGFSGKCHEMLAVFGGKTPHQHGLTAVGVTVEPDADHIRQFLALLGEVQQFIKEVMLPDVWLLAETYRDYFQIGARPARFLSFGLFDPGFGGAFPAGVRVNADTTSLQLTEITEDITYAWFSRQNGTTTPEPDKQGAYSWVKAPRYQGLAFEVGPLARQIIKNGLNPASVATGAMARIVARAEETDFIATWMEDWIRNLPASGRYTTSLPKQPLRETAIQANDAPRGTLLHAMGANVEGTDQTIRWYNVVTPSTWNFSPKDQSGTRGPVEEALVGMQLANSAQPVEAGRVIRSFDPCLSCATHCIDWEGRSLSRMQILT